MDYKKEDDMCQTVLRTENLAPASIPILLFKNYGLTLIHVLWSIIALLDYISSEFDETAVWFPDQQQDPGTAI